MLQRIRYHLAREKRLRRRAERRIENVLSLPLGEAINKLNLERYMSMGEVELEPSGEMRTEDRLEKLDETTKGLFERWSRIYVYQGDFETSLRYLEAPCDVKGAMILGESKSDGYKIALGPKRPECLEIVEGKVRDRFPSIYHFLLMLLPQ